MKRATALGITLLCFGASLYAQDRDSTLIRSVRELPMGTLDPSVSNPTLSLERYLGIYGRVAVPSIEWEVNDCGEGGDGRDAPTCVEGRARTAPDTTVAVSVKVVSSAGQPGAPRMHRLSVTQRNVPTFATSLRQFEVLAVSTVPRPAPSPVSSGGITDIMLERTWCFGRCPTDTLELRADGSAIYTGKEYTPRTGHFTGTVSLPAFNELAEWLIGEGFFDLRGSYGRPNIDAPTQVLRVTRAGEQKWVVNNSSERSVAVLAMERVVLAVAENIEWQPVQSGIRGVAAWRPPGETWQPLSETFSIYATSDEQRFHVRADAEGRFELALLPGTYRIETELTVRGQPGDPMTRVRPSHTLIVRPDALVDVSYRLDRAIGEGSFVVGAAAIGTQAKD